MSSPFLGQILITMIDGGPVPSAPDVPLEPIRPGAWAAWTSAARDETEQPRVAAVADAAVSVPQGSPARRWRSAHLAHHG